MVGVNGWLERLDSQVGVTVWLDSKSNGEKGPILSSSALQTHTRKLLLSRVFETVEKDLDGFCAALGLCLRSLSISSAPYGSFSFLGLP